MKRIALFSLLCVVTLLYSCNHESKIAPQAPKSALVLDGGHVHTGMLVVKSKEEIADTKAIHDAFKDLDVYSVTNYFKEDPRFTKRFRKAGLDKWYMVTFNPNTSITKAHSDLSKYDGFEKVEYAPVVTSTAEEYPFNDPQFSYQWHYHNTAQKTGWVAGMDINLLKAWNLETGDERVIVAIVDEGVEYDHPDLADAMWINQAELNGTPGVDDDNNGYIDDIYGYNFTVAAGSNSMVGRVYGGNHGTHVGGTVGAVNNNGINGAGVAGGNGTKKGVRLMSCQTMPGSAYIGAAFTYSADNGAVVSQNSWSIDNDADHIHTAIKYFIDYAGYDDEGNQVGPMAGGVVIFAAANDNTTKAYPAMDPNVIAVSSIGPSGAKASYSNYGEWVDIAAPGGENQGPHPVGQIFSTVTGGKFGQMSGTSMACPHVSGVAALIVSKFGGPGFTNEMLKDRLLGNANTEKLYGNDFNKGYQIGSDKDKWLLGVGLVDAFASLQDSEEDAPTKVSNISLSHLSNQITAKWRISLTGGKPSYGYIIYYSKNSFTHQDIKDKRKDIFQTSVGGASYDSDQNITYTLKGLDFSTQYHIAIISQTSTGRFSELSDVVTETTGANTAPVIALEDNRPFVLKAHEEKVIKYSASDPDGHEISVGYECNARGISLDATNSTVSISALKNEPGKYTLTLKVKDEYDATSTASVTFEILPNTPPSLVKSIENLVLNKGDEISINLSDYIIDSDGENLRYEIKSSSKSEVVKTAVSQDLLTIKGHWYGETTLTITASDAKGANISTNVAIIVRDNSHDAEGELAIDIYPNPVVTTFKIRSVSNTTASIKITNSYGGVVYNESGVALSPFAPLEVTEAQKWSSGSYTVEISAEGKVVTKNIVKL